MLFIVHEDEKIIQANKVYDPQDYDKRLDELGHKWVAVDHPGLLSPDEYYVPDGALTNRPEMEVQVSQTIIRANTSDAAIFLGAPKNTKFRIMVQESEVWSGVLPDGELELSVPVPGLYTVVFDLWPFKTFWKNVEAVS